MVHPLYANGGYGGNILPLRVWLDFLEQYFYTLWKKSFLLKLACMVHSFDRNWIALIGTSIILNFWVTNLRFVCNQLVSYGIYTPMITVLTFNT